MNEIMQNHFQFNKWVKCPSGCTLTAEDKVEIEQHIGFCLECWSNFEDGDCLACGRSIKKFDIESAKRHGGYCPDCWEDLAFFVENGYARNRTEDEIREDSRLEWGDICCHNL